MLLCSVGDIWLLRKCEMPSRRSSYHSGCGKSGEMKAELSLFLLSLGLSLSRFAL
jgi:hypothetical protein